MSGLRLQDVLPLQVIPAFTANMKHLFFSFFPPQSMNTERGNVESHTSIVFNSSHSPQFLRRLSSSTSRPFAWCEISKFFLMWWHQPPRAVIVVANFSHLVVFLVCRVYISVDLEGRASHIKNKKKSRLTFNRRDN